MHANTIFFEQTKCAWVCCVDGFSLVQKFSSLKYSKAFKRSVFCTPKNRQQVFPWMCNESVTNVVTVFGSNGCFEQVSTY